MPEEPTCKSCRFWVKDDHGRFPNEEQVFWRDCRRYPPRLVGDESRGMWHRTHSSDMCGEHQPRPDDAAELADEWETAWFCEVCGASGLLPAGWRTGEPLVAHRIASPDCASAAVQCLPRVGADHGKWRWIGAAIAAKQGRAIAATGAAAWKSIPLEPTP